MQSDSDVEILDSDGADNVSDVSSHESDGEPDSDDPDRDGRGKQKRWENKVKRRQAAAQQRQRRTGAGEAAARRAQLAAAAERLVKKNATIVLDDSDADMLSQHGDSPPRPTALVRSSSRPASMTLRELKKKEAAEKRAANRAASSEGPSLKELEMQRKIKASGRRLCDDGADADDDRALAAFEAWKPSQRRHTISPEPTATSKSKKLFNDSTASEDEDDLLPLSAAAKRRQPTASSAASTSKSTAKPKQQQQKKKKKRARSPSVDVDSRAARRARTSGRDRSEFQEEGDESSEADDTGIVINHGGALGGRFRVKAPGGRAAKAGEVRGGGGKGKGKARQVIDLEDSEEEEQSDDDDDAKGDEVFFSDRHPRGSNTPVIAKFVDPRAELRRRKQRELSDPPTDAFSSSDGEGESSDEELKARKKVRGESVGGKEAEEMAKEEKRAAERRRKAREERIPGYSNPRRN